MSVEILDPEEPRQRFKPNSWAQQQALVSVAPEVLYSGRYGSSKTRTITEKLDYRCRKHANSRVVLARKKRTDLGSTTIPVLLEQTITPSHAAWGWRPSADGGSRLYYPNGSEILCVGLDNPGKLRSGQYDMAGIDQCEELDEEEWQAVNGRLRWQPNAYVHENGRVEHAFRQLLGGCNPEGPAHFLYRRFDPTHSHRLFTKSDIKLPDDTILQAGSLWAETIMAGAHDNMENLSRDYLARLAMFKGRYYDRYVRGLWVAFEGVVYDHWDRGLHVVRRPASWRKWGGYPPPEWPIYRAIDFGYVNPFVCQWWARDPDGCFWMFREIYMTRRTIVEHGKKIRLLEEKHLTTLRERERVNARDEARDIKDIKYLNLYNSYSDHDAGDRALLEVEDIYTEPADKEVSAGIQTVYQMLTPFLDSAGQKRCRIKLVEDSLVEVDEALKHEERPLCTVDELPGYRYTPRRDSDTTKEAREEPLKENDHGCDAMRMLMHSLGLVGDTTVTKL